MTSSEEGGNFPVGSVHHTPVKSRDIGIDMEAIRLSRQDNPYLQRVADSQTTLTEEEEAAEDLGGSEQEDRAHLVTQASQEGALSLSEVHEHLIRSPPPTSLPRTLPKNVFVFPVSKGLEGHTSQGEGSAPSRSQSLKPVVTRQHEDVLDHHLRQILHTQRQLVVSRGRPGGSSGPEGSASGASSLRLPIRYPHQPAAASPLVDIT